MSRADNRQYYHPECYAEFAGVSVDEAYRRAGKMGHGDLDPEAAISVPRCAGCNGSITWRAPIVVVFPPRPGRPSRDYPVRRLTIELPADLLAAMDAAAPNRTAFIERAIRAALSQPPAE